MEARCIVVGMIRSMDDGCIIWIFGIALNRDLKMNFIKNSS